MRCNLLALFKLPVYVAATYCIQYLYFYDYSLCMLYVMRALRINERQKGPLYDDEIVSINILLIICYVCRAFKNKDNVYIVRFVGSHLNLRSVDTIVNFL